MTDLPPVMETPTRRFNEIVTTLLDALAILGISVGIGWTIQPRVGWGGALFFGSCTLAALSMITQHSQSPKAAKADKKAGAAVPGPEDPGTFHMIGR